MSLWFSERQEAWNKSVSMSGNTHTSGKEQDICKDCVKKSRFSCTGIFHAPLGILDVRRFLKRQLIMFPLIPLYLFLLP